MKILNVSLQFPFAHRSNVSLTVDLQMDDLTKLGEMLF